MRRKDGGGDSASQVLLRREYELSCNLQHPFIASTFVFLENSPVGAAIVMEYVEGRTLRDFANENPSKPARKKVLSQILDAVEYLHQKGLLHNDIKPENVMVSSVGNDVKIIDFGFAETPSDYLNRRLGGTAGASAPEVLEGGDSEASTATADMYSFGGILRLLFPGRYKCIARRCLKSDPRARYSDIASLRRALAVADGLPKVVAVLLVIILLASAALIPDYLREKEAAQEEATLQARISQIQNDLTVYYNEAADSLSDRSIFPYWDFGCGIKEVEGNFADRVFEYRKGLNQEMQFVCDTIYSRLIYKLGEIEVSIPQKNPGR